MAASIDLLDPSSKAFLGVCISNPAQNRIAFSAQPVSSGNFPEARNEKLTYWSLPQSAKIRNDTNRIRN
jgi:hypothetical protein